MNIFNTKTTGFSSATYMQESFLPKFTSQQMKTTAVALTIIAGIAICATLCIYLVNRIFKYLSSKDATPKPDVINKNTETPIVVTPNAETPIVVTPNADTPKVEDPKPAEKITKVIDPAIPFEITLTRYAQTKSCSVTGNMTIEELKKETRKIFKFSDDANISLSSEHSLENGTLADCGISEGCDIYVHLILPPGYVD